MELGFSRGINRLPGECIRDRVDDSRSAEDGQVLWLLEDFATIVEDQVVIEVTPWPRDATTEAVVLSPGNMYAATE